MTNWQLSPAGLYVSPTATDGAYVPRKSGTRFKEQMLRVVDGSNTTVTIDDTAGTVKIDAATSGMTDPTTTKGDLIGRGSSAPATRLGVGADATVLVADSTQSLGLKYENRVKSVVAGTGTTVDNTDPVNPVIGISGTSGIIPILLGFRAGAFYANPWATGSSTTNVVSGNIEFQPFPVPYGASLDQLVAEVTATNASGLVRMGIYASNSSGLPGALVLDAGTVTSLATGARTITISQTLTAGLYWLAALGDAAGGTWRTWSASPSLSAMGWSTGIASGVVYTRFTATGVATGSLPSTAPTTVATSSATGGLRVLARAA